MNDFMKRWPLSPITSSPDTDFFQHRWTDYYQAIAGRPPRETLLKTLTYVEAESTPRPGPTMGLAVDLGCGDGRDTAELLRRNWSVLAIDGEKEAITRLRRRRELNRTYLETRVQKFEDLTLPPEVDLINASFSLPFCPPEHFADLWDVIETSLKPGGWFCGQLFGDRDSWAADGNMTHHSRTGVEQLLARFQVRQLKEAEHDGQTALGEEKHWHFYHIVARKQLQ